MDGVGLSHPCDLDSGNPCRNDGVDVHSTINLKRAVESTKQALAGIPAAAIDAP